jgi:uncharacterized protein YoxC
MQLKITLLASITFLLASVGVAAQPKILEVEDNFGNTYEFDPEEGIAQASFSNEFVVKDGAHITLCATKTSIAEGDEVKFSYSSNIYSVSHPRDVDDNCFTWNISRSDYKDSWWLDIQISNKDDVSYADYKDIDHIARLNVQNLVLPEDADTTQQTYETVKIGKERYKELQEAQEQFSDVQKQNKELQNQTQELQEQIEQKNQRIKELEDKVTSLQQTITDLQQRIATLNQSFTNQQAQHDSEEKNGSGETEDNNSVFSFLGSLFK